MTSPASLRDLAGRRILVTGAAGGIGRATAEELARRGARLAVTDRADLAAVAGSTGAEPFPADLADPAGPVALVDAAAEALGGLDGVVNCAGVVEHALLPEVTLEQWERTLAVNLTAPFLICRAAVRHLAGQQGATIVNVASGTGLLPDAPAVSAYAASKGGLIAFTKALAAELAPTVRANVVCPGLTRTGMTEPVLAGRPEMAGRYALGRAADPAEIAAAIAFLTSPASSFVTGSTLAVDGGRTYH